MRKFWGFLAFLVAVVIAVLGTISGFRAGKRTGYPVAYSEYIMKYSHKNGLDECLVMAVIKVESNYIPEAQSSYAYGLMQLTEETAKWNAQKMGLKDYDWREPETNIKIGCYYLKSLIDKYENVETALAAYNAGGGNVDSWLKNSKYSRDGKTLYHIPFPETRNYVKKVEDNRQSYEKIYK